MRPQSLVTLASLLLTAPVGIFLPIPHTLHSTRAALAEITQNRKAEADHLLEQGTRQYETAEYDAALHSLQQALRLYEQSSNRDGEVQVLIVLSDLHVELDKTNQAIELGEKAVALAREIKSRLSEGRALATLGRGYFTAQQDQKAQQVSEESLKTAREGRDLQGEGRALINLSGIYNQSLKQPEQAIAFAQQAVKIAQQLKERRLEGRALWRTGQGLYNQKKYAQAIAAYQQGLEASRTVGDRRNVVMMLSDIGDVYSAVGKDAKATSYLQQSVELAATLPATNLKLVVWTSLAANYARANDNASSLKAREEALKVAQTMNDPKTLAQAHRWLGAAAHVNGDYQLAVKNQQQAVKFYRQVRDREGEVDTLTYLMESLIELKQYQEAIATGQQALQVAKSLPNKSKQYTVWADLAAAYSRSEDRANSRKAREEALKIAQSLSDPRVLAEAYQKLGANHGSGGDDKTSVQYFWRAITLYRQIKDPVGEIDTLTLLVESLMDLKQYQEAIAVSQQALQLAKDPLQQYTLWANLAATYARAGDKANHLRAREEALKAVQKASNPKKLAEAYRLLGAATSLSNDDQEALKYFQQAIELYRQQKDPQGEVDTLIFMVESLNRLKEYDRAISTSQQALQLARSLPDSKTTATALDALSNSYLNLGDKYGNEKNYAKALEMFQQVQMLGKQYRRSDLQVKALNYVGWSYRKQGDYDKAVEVLQQGLSLAQKTENAEQIMFVLIDLSSVHYLRKEYARMLDYAEQAFTVTQAQIQRSTNENDRLTWRKREGKNVLPRIALTYQLLKNYPKAIEFRQLALKNAQERNDIEDIASTAASLVGSYTDAQQNDQAITFAQAFLKQAEQQRDKKPTILAHFQVGLAYNAAKDYSKSIQAFEQGRMLAVQIGDEGLQAGALNALGELYINTEEFEKSIAFAQQALNLAKKTNNPTVEIFAFANLGRAYQGLENYPEAIKQIQKGLESAEKTDNITQQARLWMILSLIYNSSKDFPKLFEALSRSQALAQKDANSLFDSTASVLRSAACLQLGSPNCGKEDTKQPDIGDIASLDNVELLKALQLLIRSYKAFTQNKYAESLVLAEKSLPLVQKLKNLNGISVSYQFMAYNYAELGNTKQAVSMAEQGVKIAKKTKDRNLQANALGTFGEVYRKFGQVDQAIEVYQQAIAIKNDDSAAAYTGLARIYREKQPTLAIVLYKQAVNQIETLRKKNRALPKDLQESFLQSIQGLGKTKVADTYRELAEVLITQGRISEAQQVLELLKVQELNDFSKSVRSATKLPNVGLSKTELEIINQLDSLVEFSRQLSQCEQEKCQQFDQLREQNSRLSATFNNRIAEIEKNATKAGIQAIDNKIKDIQGNTQKLIEAQPNSLLIYPFASRKNIHLVWAGIGGIPYSLPPEQLCALGETAFFAKIQTFHDLLKNPNSDLNKVKTLGKELYDCLVKPLEPELAKNKIQHLIFVPDRATNYIPIGALFDGKQFLAERFSVSSALNVGSTDTQPSPLKTISDSRILALGVSKETKEGLRGFSALTNVPIELNAIAKLNANLPNGIYPGNIFLDEQFSRETLETQLLEGYKILHIATHGEFIPTNAKASYLLLGKASSFGEGSAPSSLYPISQIAALRNLGTINLVVLSACETAVVGSDPDNGTEITGISSFFLGPNKAKVVMASLWKVSDASTALMMQQFYKHLAEGKTKAQALQQVQQDFIQGRLTPKEAQNLPRSGAEIVVSAPSGTRSSPSNPPNYTHPFYWAPFILIGNSL